MPRSLCQLEKGGILPCEYRQLGMKPLLCYLFFIFLGLTNPLPRTTEREREREMMMIVKRTVAYTLQQREKVEPLIY